MTSTEKVLAEDGEFIKSVKKALYEESRKYSAAQERNLIELFHQAVSEDLDEKAKFTRNVSMLRQWLNEDRITESSKMVTNEELLHWFKDVE